MARMRINFKCASVFRKIFNIYHSVGFIVNLFEALEINIKVKSVLVHFYIFGQNLIRTTQLSEGRKAWGHGRGDQTDTEEVVQAS